MSIHQRHAELHAGAPWDRATQTVYEPEASPAPLLEPEWNLSAGQVALIVVGIVGFCEVVGTLL